MDRPTPPETDRARHFDSPPREAHRPRLRTGTTSDDPTGALRGERWVFGFPGTALAEVHTRGARLHSLQIPDRRGRFADVVLAARGAEALRGDARYFGATAGRYANRIAGGRLVIHGTAHRLGTQNTGHTLHGGPDGFDQRLWRAEPFHSAHSTGVRLFLHSPDGDQGFPGALSTCVTYTLDTGGNLAMTYRAETDMPTVVNLTNHAYWNLDGEGSGNVLAHQLQVDAAQYTAVDAELIPDGPPRPVDGTSFDLRRPHLLGDVLTRSDPQLRLAGGGYDHNWCLDGGVGARPRRVAVLHAPASGRTMEVHTTEPGIQIYTGNSLSGEITGKSGAPYGAHAGVALETQHFPDSPNRPDDPSTLLLPGEVYTSSTVLRFTVDT